MRALHPGLAVGLPEGWFGKVSLTVLAPDGEANVIVSSETVDDDTETFAYATGQGELMREEFAGYEELSFGPVDVFGGRAGWERTYRWTAEGRDHVTQIQLYYVARGRACIATATTLSEIFDEVEPTLRDVLASVRLTAAHHAPTGTRLGLRRRPA
jgi:hypothetical protein